MISWYLIFWIACGFAFWVTIRRRTFGRWWWGGCVALSAMIGQPAQGAEVVWMAVAGSPAFRLGQNLEGAGAEGYRIALVDFGEYWAGSSIGNLGGTEFRRVNVVVRPDATGAMVAEWEVDGGPSGVAVFVGTVDDTNYSFGLGMQTYGLVSVFGTEYMQDNAYIGAGFPVDPVNGVAGKACLIIRGVNGGHGSVSASTVPSTQNTGHNPNEAPTTQGAIDVDYDFAGKIVDAASAQTAVIKSKLPGFGLLDVTKPATTQAAVGHLLNDAMGQFGFSSESQLPVDLSGSGDASLYALAVALITQMHGMAVEWPQLCALAKFVATALVLIWTFWFCLRRFLLAVGLRPEFAQAPFEDV